MGLALQAITLAAKALRIQVLLARNGRAGDRVRPCDPWRPPRSDPTLGPPGVQVVEGRQSRGAIRPLLEARRHTRLLPALATGCEVRRPPRSTRPDVTPDPHLVFH